MKRLIVPLLAFLFLHPLRADDTPPGPTYARYVPERKDDFAWENDKVAFRTYGPALKNSPEHENSGIDCWFKRTKKPIINAWYAGEQKGVSYHKDNGDGYDGYHVGPSRGCGGTALWKDNQLVLSGVYAAQKIVSQLPEQSVFELTYEYDLGTEKIQESKRITIEAGKQLFRSESTFTKDGKPAAGLEVAVAVATHDGKGQVTQLLPSGLISVWEVIDRKGVGTGVVFPPGKTLQVHDLKSNAVDESHAVLVTKTDEHGREVHYAGFAWAGAGEITTSAAWYKYLADFTAALKE